MIYLVKIKRNMISLNVGSDEIIKKNTEIADAFNKYFANIAVETTGAVGESINDY